MIKSFDKQGVRTSYDRKLGAEKNLTMGNCKVTSFTVIVT